MVVVVAVGYALDHRRWRPVAPGRLPAAARTLADLATERAGFRTHLRRHGPAPGPQRSFDPPSDADDVTYASDGLSLHAWRSKPPTDGRRHPAVVYLHGNFTFEPPHWTATRPYRDAGMVVMTPMTRGENGNPGEFELFYGEVDDVVAAGRSVASLPYVDPNRVYLAGHSVGGTLVMLAAAVPGPYAAMAAFSGSPDQYTFLGDVGPSVRVIDMNDATEMRLRSAEPFVAGLRCPLYVFDGDGEDWAIPQTRRYVDEARAAGRACELHIVPGDHRSSKPLAIAASVPLLLNERRR